MITKAKKTSTTDRFLAQFKDIKETAFSSDTTDISQLRKYAISYFEKLGIPTRKVETWKYTPISKALNKNWTYRSAESNFNFPEIENLQAHELILSNNQYKEGLNPLPQNIISSSMEAAFQNPTDHFVKHYGSYAHITTEPLTALNTAFAKNGIYLHIPDGTVLDLPIHIITIINSEDTECFHPRNLIHIGKNSNVKIIESTYLNTGDQKNPLFINKLSEIICEENSFIDRYELQTNDCNKTVLVNTSQVHQTANSNFTNTVITTNSSFTRNNINIDHEGENCETNLFGMYTLNKEAHLDNHTLINHNTPNCLSNELYAGILNDKSTGVFNGKVYVKKDAQKTNAFQSNRNILLSDESTMNSKPELEIYADDVKCSHGSTTGQLEEEALFYLRSRGISEDNATSMLLIGFVSEIIDRIKIEALKEHLTTALTNNLSA